jgi:hypothetical protein
MVVKLARALYGLKSSGALWQAMFNSSLLDMGFQSTIADPDVYRQANTKPCGFKYYEYLLVYVDNVLIVLHSPKIHLEKIKESYVLNPSSVGPQRQYLGTDVEQVTRPRDNTGRKYWSFSAHTHVHNAVQNVKLLLQEEGWGLKSTAKAPISSTTYRPEMDVTEEFNADESSRHLQLIGVL